MTLFDEALRALGVGELPQVADAADARFHEAAWIKLRQAYEAPPGLRGFDPVGFSYGDLVTVADMRRYLDAHETS